MIVILKMCVTLVTTGVVITFIQKPEFHFHLGEGLIFAGMWVAVNCYVWSLKETV